MRESRENVNMSSHDVDFVNHTIMLTLRLSGFRCYDQEEAFSFTSSEIIRIRGDSGVGKTTILDAIQWVLYNYPTTNIYPRHGKNKNTHVILTMPWKDGILTVERRKNPGLFILTHPDGHQEEDDVAQGTIENLFGTRDIWRACCYLPQDENCPLLGFSNAQRMEILEALAFLSEKPDDDLEKISEEIRRLQALFTVADQELTQLERELQEFSLPGQPEDLLIDDEMRKKVLLRQEDIKTRIKALKQQQSIVEERKKQRILLEDRLKKSQQALAKLDPVNPDEITQLDEEIKDLQLELSFSQQVEAKQRLENKHNALLDQLKKLPVPDREYTQEEYQDAFSMEKKIVDEQRIAQTWKVNYHRETILHRLTKIRTLLDAQKDIQTWARITKLQDQLDAMTGPDVKQEDLDKARDEFKALERSVDVHKCPSCKRSLRYIRNVLVLSETSPVPADKIKKMKEALGLMEAAYRESHERQMVTVQLQSLLSTVSGGAPEEKALKAAEIKKLEQESQDLARLVFPEKPKVTSRDIQKSQEYAALRKELRNLEDELARYPVSDDPQRGTQEIMASLNTCQTRLRQLRDILPRREMLEGQIKTYLADLDGLPLLDAANLEAELDRLSHENSEITLAFEEDTLARNYLALEARCQQRVNQVNQLNTELAAAIRLRDLAQREVCEILEEKIATINEAIAEICNKVFREPITIELSMLKTTKTTKVTKPCVHLKIWHKDAEYDSISQMSGGEKKRISIAVSLALAQLNTFPVILMDECLNGVDEELREATLEIFHEMSGGKTILCVMHDGIEGLYDRVVSLNEER